MHKGRGDWFILSVEVEMPSSIASQIAASQRVLAPAIRAPRLQNFNGELQVEAEYLFAFNHSRPPPRSEESGQRLHGESARGVKKKPTRDGRLEVGAPS